MTIGAIYAIGTSHLHILWFLEIVRAAPNVSKTEDGRLVSCSNETRWGKAADHETSALSRTHSKRKAGTVEIQGQQSS